jgi:hypothetical protein
MLEGSMIEDRSAAYTSKVDNVKASKMVESAALSEIDASGQIEGLT